MAQVHPVWGRPFEQYIDSYNVEATKHRITWRHDFELDAARLEAAEVTQKLYELAGEWEKVDTRKLDGYITLPMLKSLDKLSYSPITLVDFGHTAHISGCIKLLWAASKSAQRSGQSAIFSHEYGYLCFRIIMTTIGVCILQRLDQFSETLHKMLTDPSADLAATISRRVSELIEEEVGASTNERYFDRILGWAKFKDHPVQEPFAIRSDMWMLLNLLYDDRKHFLSLCTSTYSLGLSGLMFLLWRYHRFDWDYLKFLGKCSTSGQTALRQIVDEIVENDFVELALRVVLMLDMKNYDVSDEHGLSIEYYRILSHIFQDAGYDWYLRWRRTLTGLTEGEMSFLFVAGKSLGMIIAGLQQGFNIQEFEHPPGTCSYSRCAQPAGARHACGICMCLFYCSIRCQAADWRGTTPQNPHKKLCPGDLKSMTPQQLLKSLRDHGHLAAMDVTGMDLSTIFH
ncbi:unnamed protein product [Rhizoctonia solani]|uniref:MYND-type domain-containing protein n=1 Tax=Rhizoctonia solani TaxID=456999 RepID=A0A8H3CS90_9AGAM|nr:unnamed protein product [Rhizoctonia solani]